MKDNIKKQLENIRLDAINELDNFILLIRTVIDSNCYIYYDHANNYIVNLYELAPGNALCAVTALHENITKFDYTPDIALVLSDCERIVTTLTTFYYTSLTSHIEQLQNILDNGAQISRNVLTAFLSVTQTLQNQLKQS